MSPLEASGIHHAYRQGGAFGRRPRVAVLEGASITIGAGECVALLGPTGSGKSTLGRIVLGLERPDAGEVRFGGAPLLDRRGRMAPTTRRVVPCAPASP